MSFKNISNILKFSYHSTLKTFKKFPKIFIPFIIFSVLELFSLLVIYLAPREPFRVVFGPPIRTLWGEKFLHFPFNFLLYPKILSLCRMGLTIFVGSLLTAIAVFLIINIYHNKSVKFSQALKNTLPKYFSLVIVLMVFTAIFYVITKITFIGLIWYFRAGHQKLLFLKPEIWLGPILMVLNFILAIIIQSVFTYVIPVLINETANPIKAIFRSFIIFKNTFIPTIVLVGLPMLIYIPKILMDFNLAFLMDKFFPEIVIFISITGIIINSLIIDSIITTSTTFLYLKHREK